MRLTSVLNISHITQPRFPGDLPYYYATKAIYAEQAVVLPHSSQMLDQGMEVTVQLNLDKPLICCL